MTTPDRFKWGLRERLERLKSNLETGVRACFQLRMGMYRPYFVKQSLYFDRGLIQMIYQMPSMFPTPGAPNQVIGVTGRGATGVSML